MYQEINPEEYLINIRNNIEQNIQVLEQLTISETNIDEAISIGNIEDEIKNLKEISKKAREERDTYKEYAIPAMQELLSRKEFEDYDKVRKELQRYTKEALDARDKTMNKIIEAWTIKARTETENQGYIMQNLNKCSKTLERYISREKDRQRKAQLINTLDKLNKEIEDLDYKIQARLEYKFETQYK